jgi:hypothetical protein
MKKLLLSVVTASALIAGVAPALAQTTTTTTTRTWTDDDGAVIREYSTTKNYTPISNPELRPEVGVVLPGEVKVYSLPETVKVEDPDRYSYTIINEKPVVVERSTRRVVHVW